MALKVLKLRQQQTIKRTALQKLRDKADQLKNREVELEQAIQEAATEEDLQAVEQAVSELDTQTQENTAAIEALEQEIADLQQQLDEAEAEQDPQPEGEARGRNNINQERNVIHMPNTRMTWREMFAQRREALRADPAVKAFAQRLRAMRGQNRSVTGADLGIPPAYLPILRLAIEESSKLYRHVTVTALHGQARQNIAGEIPEGIWFEMDGALNELEINFTQLEMDGYGVGGYIAIPNPVLEDDDDLQLAETVVDYMARSIGKAFDKACVYGTGSRTMVGWVTRLAASAKPAWWGGKQGDFTDLHTSNILKLNLAEKSGAEFFRPLIAALAVAKPDYAAKSPVWVMNRKTHLDLMSQALAFDASAALVAGVNNTFPVVGGEIVELEFMSDYEITGGFVDMMRVVERAGTSLDSSDKTLFIENQTVFRAIARYDGKPAYGEAAVLINYHNTEPATAKTFGRDAANTEIGTLIVTTAAGAASGKTAVTVAGATSGAKLVCRVAGTPIGVKNGEKLGDDWAEVTSGGEVKAATGNYITVAELDADGRAAKVGAGTVTAKA